MKMKYDNTTAAIIELARDIAKGDEAREIGTLRGIVSALVNGTDAKALTEALLKIANKK